MSARNLRRGTGNRPQTAADEVSLIDRKKRRTLALQLRSAHATIPQIARQTGVSIRQVRRDLDRAISEIGAEDSVQAKALLNAQHDADLLRLEVTLRRTEEIFKESKKADIPRVAAAIANLTRSKTRIAVAKADLNVEPMPTHVTHAHSGEIDVVTVTPDDLLSRLDRIAAEGRASADHPGTLTH